jgi:putative YphP/YqiW family bacilliredoxin
MKYPPHLTEPMRGELVRIGVRELRTPEEVDSAIRNTPGTVLVFVNSVCGCAAGSARPGLAIALQDGRVKPDEIATTFAGVDVEATARVRSYMPQYPPSSPQIALFKNGQVVELIQRHQIEGTSPDHVASLINGALEKHCAPAAS